MNSITPAIRRKLVSRLNRDAVLLEDHHPQDARECETLAARIAPQRRQSKALPFATRKQDKQEKIDVHQKSTAAIRPAVFARAGDRCEAWHPDPEVPGQWKRCEKAAKVWDHWMGGTGRRRQKQSVENTWALCDEDNFMRTEKLPNSGYWNTSFGIHCRHNGLPFTPHIEHQQLKTKRTA